MPAQSTDSFDPETSADHAPGSATVQGTKGPCRPRRNDRRPCGRGPPQRGRLIRSPRRPAPERRRMFTYRLHLADGSDDDEVTYAVMVVKVGEEILAGGRRFRVLDVVPFGEETESPFVGLLQVEAA